MRPFFLYFSITMGCRLDCALLVSTVGAVSVDTSLLCIVEASDMSSPESLSEETPDSCGDSTSGSIIRPCTVLAFLRAMVA